MFRGRGGANDRRLPKQNARRRKGQGGGTSKPTSNKYEKDDNDGYNRDRIPQQQHNDDGERHETNTDEMMEEEGDQEEQHHHDDAKQGNGDQDSSKIPTLPPPWKIEINHLRKRVKNVQQSIQFSADSITNPTTYNQNVLNAVLNSVNEWRSIIVHYNYKTIDDNNDNSNSDDIMDSNDDVGEGQLEQQQHQDEDKQYPFIIDPVLTKETSLEVFMLIQLALQSGPLQGSKPGYFKRCGSEVATVVVDFLNVIVELLPSLEFTEKQRNQIILWQTNAEKAAAQNKPPSKSVLKKQQQNMNLNNNKKGKKTKK